MSSTERLSVAVLLVSFNQQDYIIDALDGIRSQSIMPDEVVIADDGSIDNTQSIIFDYVKKYGLEASWNLLLSEKNRGINQNINSAVSVIKSDIIVPMAGDDISLPNRCERAVSLFSAMPDINIINTNGYIIDENGVVLRPTLRPCGLHKDIASTIRRGFPPLSPVGECWRRSLFAKIGHLPNDVPNEDDQISFYGLVTGGVYCDSDVTFKYRIHGKSASSWLRNKKNNQQFFDRFVRDMEIRKRHMLYWQEALIKLDRAEDGLLKMLRSKVMLYQHLSCIEGSSWIERVIFCLHNSSVISVREFVYMFFGKFGILGWRFARQISGRDKW